MTPTLYLTRNGLLEPLGQSQVLAYLRGLSRDYRITLITYEKDEDRTDAARIAAMRAECERLGIRWLPQRFRPRPKVIAPALSMLRMIWLLRREVRGQGARLIHARSYIPAAVALIVSRMTGVPFIFDMRALWPEELITAGRLRRGSVLHRAITGAERACLRRAGAVVSLTNAAVDHLSSAYPADIEGQRVAVIPTCADLNRFTPLASKHSGPRIYGCIGTILSGWFRVDWLSALFQTAACRDASARFDIVTRDEPEAVRKAVDPAGVLGERLTIAGRAPQEMPDAVRVHDVSVMFYAGGAISELGRSPTRLGEVLGCGVPVIANAGVGDVAGVVTDHNVGVLASGPTQAEMNVALDDLDKLMADPVLPARCRAAAEAVFSLDSGVAAYDAIYRQVAGAPRKSAT